MLLVMDNVKNLWGMARRNVLFIALFLIFFFLRFYGIGERDFWYDEIGSVNYAIYPWGNWNAPLYWLILHGWVKLFGFSHLALRFPSLIFSSLALLATFFLGKELFNKKIALTAFVIMGLSPFHLWYAQEARDYSMTLFLAVCSTYVFFRALKESRMLTWGLFALISLAGVYTNYFYIILFLVHAGILAVVRKKKVSFFEVAFFLGVVAVFGCYLSKFLGKFFYVAGGFWLPPPKAASLLITFENFLLGYGGDYFLYFAADMLFGLVLCLAFLYIWRCREDVKMNFFLCACLWAIPLASIFVFSKAFFSIYLDRGMIIFSPFLYLSLSAGFSFLSLWARRFLLGAAVFVLMMAMVSFYLGRMSSCLEHHEGVWLKKPIRPAVRFWEKHAAFADMLVFTNDSIRPSWFFYQKNKQIGSYYLFDPGLPDANWHRPLLENEYCIPYYKINEFGFRNLWVVFSDWPHDGSFKDSLAIRQWLDRHFQSKSIQYFDGMWLVQYERPLLK